MQERLATTNSRLKKIQNKLDLDDNIEKSEEAIIIEERGGA